jgi:hypothetical protein
VYTLRGKKASGSGQRACATPRRRANLAPLLTMLTMRTVRIQPLTATALLALSDK